MINKINVLLNYLENKKSFLEWDYLFKIANNEDPETYLKENFPKIFIIYKNEKSKREKEHPAKYISVGNNLRKKYTNQEEYDDLFVDELKNDITDTLTFEDLKGFLKREDFFAKAKGNKELTEELKKKIKNNKISKGDFEYILVDSSNHSLEEKVEILSSVYRKKDMVLRQDPDFIINIYHYNNLDDYESAISNFLESSSYSNTVKRLERFYDYIWDGPKEGVVYEGYSKVSAGSAKNNSEIIYKDDEYTVIYSWSKEAVQYWERGAVDISPSGAVGFYTCTSRVDGPEGFDRENLYGSYSDYDVFQIIDNSSLKDGKPMFFNEAKNSPNNLYTVCFDVRGYIVDHGGATVNALNEDVGEYELRQSIKNWPKIKETILSTFTQNKFLKSGLVEASIRYSKEQIEDLILNKMNSKEFFSNYTSHFQEMEYNVDSGELEALQEKLNSININLQNASIYKDFELLEELTLKKKSIEEKIEITKNKKEDLFASKFTIKDLIRYLKHHAKNLTNEEYFNPEKINKDLDMPFNIDFLEEETYKRIEEESAKNLLKFLFLNDKFYEYISSSSIRTKKDLSKLVEAKVSKMSNLDFLNFYILMEDINADKYENKYDIDRRRLSTLMDMEDFIKIKVFFDSDKYSIINKIPPEDFYKIDLQNISREQFSQRFFDNQKSVFWNGKTDQEIFYKKYLDAVSKMNPVDFFKFFIKNSLILSEHLYKVFGWETKRVVTEKIKKLNFKNFAELFFVDINDNGRVLDYEKIPTILRDIFLFSKNEYKKLIEEKMNEYNGSNFLNDEFFDSMMPFVYEILGDKSGHTEAYKGANALMSSDDFIILDDDDKKQKKLLVYMLNETLELGKNKQLYYDMIGDFYLNKLKSLETKDLADAIVKIYQYNNRTFFADNKSKFTSLENYSVPPAESIGSPLFFASYMQLIVKDSKFLYNKIQTIQDVEEFVDDMSNLSIEDLEGYSLEEMQGGSVSEKFKLYQKCIDLLFFKKHVDINKKIIEYFFNKLILFSPEKFINSLFIEDVFHTLYAFLKDSSPNFNRNLSREGEVENLFQISYSLEYFYKDILKNKMLDFIKKNEALGISIFLHPPKQGERYIKEKFGELLSYEDIYKSIINIVNKTPLKTYEEFFKFYGKEYFAPTLTKLGIKINNERLHENKKKIAVAIYRKYSETKDYEDNLFEAGDNSREFKREYLRNTEKIIEKLKSISSAEELVMLINGGKPDLLEMPRVNSNILVPSLRILFESGHYLVFRNSNEKEKEEIKSYYEKSDFLAYFEDLAIRGAFKRDEGKSNISAANKFLDNDYYKEILKEKTVEMIEEKKSVVVNKLLTLDFSPENFYNFLFENGDPDSDENIFSHDLYPISDEYSNLENRGLKSFFKNERDFEMFFQRILTPEFINSAVHYQGSLKFLQVINSLHFKNIIKVDKLMKNLNDYFKSNYFLKDISEELNSSTEYDLGWEESGLIQYIVETVPSPFSYIKQYLPLSEAIISQLEKYMNNLKDAGIKEISQVPKKVKNWNLLNNKLLRNAFFKEEKPEEEMLDEQETDQEQTFSEEVDLEKVENEQEETFSEKTEEDEKAAEETMEVAEETYIEEE